MLATLADVYASGWTRTDELLASLIEMVDDTGWRAVSPYLKKSAKPKRVVVPRPGVKRRHRRKATADDLKRMFGGGRYCGGEVSDGG